MTILSHILLLLGCEHKQPDPVDIEPILDGLAASYATEHGVKLDWRHSVVDLMKALGMDSSIKERDALAKELHYPAGIDGSVTAMNVWLHKEIMRRVAGNGGKVPAELL